MLCGLSDGRSYRICFVVDDEVEFTNSLVDAKITTAVKYHDRTPQLHVWDGKLGQWNRVWSMEFSRALLKSQFGEMLHETLSSVEVNIKG